MGPGLGSNYVDVGGQVRIKDWPFTFLYIVFLQGPLVFGAFALGLAAAKTHFFSHDSRGMTLLRKRLPILILIGLSLNAWYAAVVSGLLPDTQGLLSLFGFVSIAVGAPALSLVYLYCLVQISRRIIMPHVLILIGRNSLSCYVAQGVIAGFFFGSYGLGLFGTLDQVALLPLSLLISLLAMFFVGVFASVFGRGPLEFVLRAISGTR